MIKTNYHTHNDLCDGKGKIVDYIEAAVSKGFTALGFSSHAPIPVENKWTLTEERLPVYLAEVDRVKAEYEGRIQVYKGLEIDYIPGSQTPADMKFKALGLDYSIGSVHSSLGLDRNPEYLCIDGPVDELKRLLDDFHGGSWQALSEAFFTRIVELVRIGGFSFLGHMDLVKKRNRDGEWFDERAPWYARQVRTALDELAGSGIMMEINSGGISRGILDEVYPSPWIIAEAHKREIPVVISADAHRPEDIDCNFEESRKLLRETGYREAWAFVDNSWRAITL